MMEITFPFRSVAKTSVALSLLAASAALQAAVVTVTPSDSQGWWKIFQAGAATVEITTTEAYGPGGTASLEYSTTDSVDDIVGVGKLFLSNKLADLNVAGMDYWSDADNPPPSMRIEYQRLIPSLFGTLVWSPAVGAGSWDTMPDASAEQWRDTRTNVSKTLAEWQADPELDDANIRYIYVAVGRDTNAGRTVFADLINLEFEGDAEATTYDFEEAGALPEPPTQISASGLIESRAGGFKYPDGTIQTTAATIGVIPPPAFPSTYINTEKDLVGGVNTFVGCDAGDQIIGGGGRCHGVAAGPLDPMSKSCPADDAGACRDSGGTDFTTWAVQCDLNAKAVAYAVCLDTTP